MRVEDTSSCDAQRSLEVLQDRLSGTASQDEPKVRKNSLMSPSERLRSLWDIAPRLYPNSWAHRTFGDVQHPAKRDCSRKIAPMVVHVIAGAQRFKLQDESRSALQTIQGASYLS